MNRIAARYALAFFHAVKSVDLEKANTELGELDEVFKRAKLGLYLGTPLFDKSKKHAILSEVFKHNDFLPHTRHFMALLIEKKRINLFPEMCKQFSRLYHNEKNMLEVTCKSARKLSEETISKLTQKLQKTFNKNILLDLSTDPSLIGGLTVQIGSKLYDFSIKNQLEAIKRRYVCH